MTSVTEIEQPVTLLVSNVESLQELGAEFR
jgi:hypothetical protein